MTWPKIEGIDEIVELRPVTFINGDNMALLRWMKQEMMMGYFHVGIVDPPYGINVTKWNLGTRSADRKEIKYSRHKWDLAIPTEEYWSLLKYCCRNIICWGGNYFTKEINFSGRCFVVWDKMNDGLSFAGGELALTTFDENACFIRRPRNKKGEDESEKRHDTQKPVYVYDYLYLKFIKRGQRVLDTHGGSFNHAVAAYKNNIDLTIMDIDKSYFDSGIDNYKKYLNKPRILF